MTAARLKASRTLAMEVEENLRLALRVRDWRVVWTQRLAAALQRPEEQIIDAMLILQSDAKLSLKCRVSCPYGHSIWDGLVSELPPKYAPTDCRACDDSWDDEHARWSYYVQLEHSWVEAIRAAESPEEQKKRLLSLGIGLVRSHPSRKRDSLQ